MRHSAAALFRQHGSSAPLCPSCRKGGAANSPAATAAARGPPEAAAGRRQSRRCREGPERARWFDKNCVACLCLLLVRLASAPCANECPLRAIARGTRDQCPEKTAGTAFGFAPRVRGANR